MRSPRLSATSWILFGSLRQSPSTSQFSLMSLQISLRRLPKPSRVSVSQPIGQSVNQSASRSASRSGSRSVRLGSCSLVSPMTCVCFLLTRVAAYDQNSGKGERSYSVDVGNPAPPKQHFNFIVLGRQAPLPLILILGSILAGTTGAGFGYVEAFAFEAQVPILKCGGRGQAIASTKKLDAGFQTSAVSMWTCYPKLRREQN